MSAKDCPVHQEIVRGKTDFIVTHYGEFSGGADVLHSKVADSRTNDMLLWSCPGS